MDYSYYSIYEVPLITYGMIAVTTGVLVFVSMADEKGGDLASEPAAASSSPEPEPEPSSGEEQMGGKRKKKKGSKQKRASNTHKKHTTKRHR